MYLGESVARILSLLYLHYVKKLDWKITPFGNNAIIKTKQLGDHGSESRSISFVENLLQQLKENLLEAVENPQLSFYSLIMAIKFGVLESVSERQSQQVFVEISFILFHKYIQNSEKT